MPDSSRWAVCYTATAQAAQPAEARARAWASADVWGMS